MSTPQPTILLGTKEVAELIGTPEATLRYWTHQGKGPKSARIGRRRVYRKADVLEWLDKAFASGTAQ